MRLNTSSRVFELVITDSPKFDRLKLSHRMAKNVPDHLIKKTARCIFCDGPGRTKTHIWPDWLNKLLKPGPAHLQELGRADYRAGEVNPTRHQLKTKKGSMFSQKPYLACERCNNGWMKWFEDEMGKFAKPLFTSLENVTLSAEQMTVLSSWAALIAILAEFMDRSMRPTISLNARRYLMKNKRPPDDWTIVAGSQEAKQWYAKYRHQTLFMGKFATMAEFKRAVQEGRPTNTIISTFGMGRLFVQIFVCPDPRYVADFRAYAAREGLIQIWPLQFGPWPFVKGAKFPTPVIPDQRASELADAYKKRIDTTTITPESLG